MMLRFFSVLFFIVGIVILLVGFHNIDISFNMNDNQIDTSPLGIIRNKIELYLLGVQGIILGVVFMLIGYSALLWNLFITDNFKFK